MIGNLQEERVIISASWLIFFWLLEDFATDCTDGLVFMWHFSGVIDHSTCSNTASHIHTLFFFVLSTMHANACLRCTFRFDILACGLQLLGTGTPKHLNPEPEDRCSWASSAPALIIWLYYDVCVVDVSMYVPVGVDRNQMFPDSTWQR